MGMINFLSQSAQGKSIDQNNAKLINLYLNPEQNNGKYQVVGYPTPGCTLFATLPASPVRALLTVHSVTYWIAGNRFGSVDSIGTVTTIGTLNTSSGWAKIRANVGQLFMADTANGYYYTPVSSTFGQIVDSNFPNNLIQDIECQDEWGLVLLKNSQTWQSSQVSDVTKWPALFFASTTGNQNYNTGLVSIHREIFLLGTQTSEVWDNVGTNNFTFGRNQSAYIEFGCSAVASIAKGDNTAFFLGRSITGGNIVVKMNGYSPQKISTSAIDYQISTYSTVSDAIGFMYQQEGHEFYVLTFPTANVTWVWDESVGVWHQRQSNGNCWLASCYTENYNKKLVGDLNSATLYYLDMTNDTENGTAITRTIQTNPMYADGVWAFADKLQIDFDNSPGAALSNWTLQVSRDGGRTFGTGKPAIVQTDCNGQISIYWNRLGKAKCFVFNLSTSYPMQTIVLGAWALVRNQSVQGAQNNA